MTTFDEKYEFTAKAKRNLAIILVVGVVLTVLGILLNIGGGGHEEEHAATQVSTQLLASTDAIQEHATAVEAEHHETVYWLKRLYSDLWINNMFFVGLGVIGLFFFALQYASQAFWSTGMLRVAMAIGNWLPYAFVLIIGVFFLANGDIFHWTHADLYDINSADYDPIIAGKQAYLNMPFFVGRMVVFMAGWYLFFLYMKKNALAEDIEDGGTQRWKKIRSASAWFLVFFAVSSSMSAWDWIMSIDTHWFSTLFGWYVFSSWWVSGLALIALIVIVLKEKGYLSIVTSDHLHDIGKFVFGFSIFWTYLWFSQFLLIYYANIPEEAVYFVQRLTSHQYRPVFHLNILINFVFPFLFLMSRDSKRQMTTLKIASIIVLLGHWLDFYLMVTPGVMKQVGGFGFMEIGTAMIYLAAFMWVVLSNLAKHPLIAKNHPTLQESLHHHI
jgi:hypothetical protein